MQHSAVFVGCIDMNGTAVHVQKPHCNHARREQGFGTLFQWLMQAITLFFHPSCWWVIPPKTFKTLTCLYESSEYRKIKFWVERQLMLAQPTYCKTIGSIYTWKLYLHFKKRKKCSMCLHAFLLVMVLKNVVLFPMVNVWRCPYLVFKKKKMSMWACTLFL